MTTLRFPTSPSVGAAPAHPRAYSEILVDRLDSSPGVRAWLRGVVPIPGSTSEPPRADVPPRGLFIAPATVLSVAECRTCGARWEEQIQWSGATGRMSLDLIHRGACDPLREFEMAHRYCRRPPVPERTMSHLPALDDVSEDVAGALDATAFEAAFAASRVADGYRRAENRVVVDLALRQAAGGASVESIAIERTVTTPTRARAHVGDVHRAVRAVAADAAARGAAVEALVLTLADEAPSWRARADVVVLTSQRAMRFRSSRQRGRLGRWMPFVAPHGIVDGLLLGARASAA